MSRRRFMWENKKLVEVIQEITSSRSWIPPAGCTSVDVFLCGGGGGGGGGAIGDSPGGSGGGGGYTNTYYNVPVTPGSAVSITVGSGGYGGSRGSSSKAGTGGMSVFMLSAYAANGGEGGCNRLNSSYGKGGNGGSGGGGADSGNGGSNGSNGGAGAQASGGTGQPHLQHVLLMTNAMGEEEARRAPRQDLAPMVQEMVAAGLALVQFLTPAAEVVEDGQALPMAAPEAVV